MESTKDYNKKCPNNESLHKNKNKINNSMKNVPEIIAIIIAAVLWSPSLFISHGKAFISYNMLPSAQETLWPLIVSATVKFCFRLNPKPSAVMQF